MRKQRVPTEQISLFLRHLPSGSAATTSIYAPSEPGFLADAVEAIESVMAEMRTHLKLVQIDRPEIDPAELAETTSRPRRHGIGETKRQEVRWLILSGVPHAEVVPRSGASSGTVSAIRQELKASMPLDRNTESDLCVPIACPLDDEQDRDHPQVFERSGGAGSLERTGLCAQVPCYQGKYRELLQKQAL
jgi:hypothetical protein